jgi:MFS family permease
MGLVNPLTLVSVSNVAAPEERSGVLALRIMCNYIGQTVSPVAFGALAGILGLAPVFWFSGAVLLACISGTGSKRA